MPKTRSHILAIIFSAALSFFLIFPSWYSGHLIGHPALDVWSHAWGMDWFSSSIRKGVFPWYVDGVAWPQNRILWYIDPIGALVFTPFSWFLGPITSYNLLIALQIFLLGWATWLFAQTQKSKGWLAMTILCTSPYLMGEYWNGVIEAGWLALIPFAGYLAGRSSKYTGILVGLAALGTPYHGVSAALLVTTIILGHRTQSWGIRLRRLVVAGALALLVAIPHIILLRLSFHGELSFVNRSIYEGYNPALLISNAIDPSAFFTQGDFWTQKINNTRLGVPWHKTPYLGWLAIGGSLALLIFRTRKAILWLPVLIGISFTLGVFLWHDGQWVVAPNGGYYQLPLAYLAQWVPVPVDHPMRFVGIALCGLALMSDRFFGKFGWLLCGLVVYENLYLAPNSWPLPHTDAQLPDVYKRLPNDGSAILDLPADLGVGNHTNRYLFWQRLHQHPIPWSNKVSAMGVASKNPAVISWAALSGDVTGYIEGLDPNATITQKTLQKENYSTIILHLDLLKNTQEIRKYETINSIFGQPQKSQSVWVWKVPTNHSTLNSK